MRAPGAASSVFDGVAALMGLLFLRGVCLVRGEDILGERAALVAFSELTITGDVVMSMESEVAAGLVVVVVLTAGGVFGVVVVLGEIEGGFSGD